MGPGRSPGGGARVLLGLLSLLVGAAIWLPCLHLVFRADPTPVLDHTMVSRQAQALAARHLQLWRDPDLQARDIAPMRRTNPEMVFMGRSFLVWGLANLARRDPAREGELLQVIDQIIAATVAEEDTHGIYHFLMSYADASPWVQQPPRSLFVDSEIALMLGLRRLVAEREDYRPLMTERIQVMRRRMEQAPLLCAESYPDECWTFDCANALAAMRVADVLDGSDHRPLMRAWVARARERLLEPRTGLLVSCFTFDGEEITHGPEGSTIWQTTHALALVDPDLAREQYQRARSLLGRSLLGFGVAREWPVELRGHQDVDSGMIIPIIDASPSSSGLALVAASTFGDGRFLGELLASLELAALPVREGETLRYGASNQVGDAVLLYALTTGPLWQQVGAP